MKTAIRRFIETVLQGRYEEWRRENNSMRKFLTEEQASIWETPIATSVESSKDHEEFNLLTSSAKTSSNQVIETVDVWDLLLRGQEVAGSCQRITGGTSWTEKGKLNLEL
jgi:hypothetical protein